MLRPCLCCGLACAAALPGLRLNPRSALARDAALPEMRLSVHFSHTKRTGIGRPRSLAVLGCSGSRWLGRCAVGQVRAVPTAHRPSRPSRRRRPGDRADCSHHRSTRRVNNRRIPRRVNATSSRYRAARRARRGTPERQVTPGIRGAAPADSLQKSRTHAESAPMGRAMGSAQRTTGTGGTGQLVRGRTLGRRRGRRPCRRPGSRTGP